MAKKRLSETVIGRFLGIQGKKSVPKTATSSSGSSFKSAFAAARKAQGAGGTFTWKGNKYTTNYAEEAKAKKPAATKIVANSGSKDQAATKIMANPKRRGPRVSPKAASQTAALKDLKAKMALEKMRATKTANSSSAAPKMYRPSEAKLNMYKRNGIVNGDRSQMAQYTKEQWRKMTPMERLKQGLPTTTYANFMTPHSFKTPGPTSREKRGTTPMGYPSFYASGGMTSNKTRKK
jgi:hypothetical protein